MKYFNRAEMKILTLLYRELTLDLLIAHNVWKVASLAGLEQNV